MDISSHSSLTTIGGWTVIAAVGGYLWYRSMTSKKSRAQPAKPSTRVADAIVPTESKKKTEKATKPKQKPKSSPIVSDDVTASTPKYDWEQDEAADKKADREFARQLATTHAGTQFNAKRPDEKRQKSIKQSKALEIDTPAERAALSPPSSTTGDADDDLSSQASPVVGPVVANAVSGLDVSDMLAPPSPGPSVLRLTDTDSVKKPQERKARSPEKVETKKQRQNRKKAEAAKAAREEDEKERKVKMEQQRRAARIAEGRPAKDGQALMAAQNAWKDKPSTSTAAIKPLDTMEQRPKPEPTKASIPPPPATTVTTKATSDPWSGMPSEEEQMEMLRHEESWNEVKTKKKGRKNNGNVAADTSSTFVPATNGTNGTSWNPPVKPPVKAPVNGTKKPILTSSSSSFAALTPEETDDNDEVEKEWDV
ncbi:hypothetical protein F4778DRAFT_780855 [Xylariomycetidae sp. FL2044]|nr:hypothetical protein F4778DRAFT_780855 [Xylariomycetidae sp. FL2044]